MCSIRQTSLLIGELQEVTSYFTHSQLSSPHWIVQLVSPVVAESPNYFVYTHKVSPPVATGFTGVNVWNKATFQNRRVFLHPDVDATSKFLSCFFLLIKSLHITGLPLHTHTHPHTHTHTHTPYVLIPRRFSLGSLFKRFWESTIEWDVEKGDDGQGEKDPVITQEQRDCEEWGVGTN